jgi:hypothetical protein
MTPEEMAALVAAVTEAIKPAMNEAANAAATAHTKRLEKTFADKIAAQAPVVPAAVDPQVAAVGEKIKADPAMSALQAQIAELTKKNEAAEKARAAAEQKQRDESTFSSLKGLLNGVKPDLQDAAAKLLFHVDKRVEFDESGNPLFRMKKDDGNEVLLPLDSGVEHWLKSKEAMPFLPAPASGGAAGRGGRAPGGIPSGRSANGMPTYDKPATTDFEKVSRAKEQAAALEKILGLQPR